jgi:hypothetical protein
VTWRASQGGDAPFRCSLFFAYVFPCSVTPCPAGCSSGQGPPLHVYYRLISFSFFSLPTAQVNIAPPPPGSLQPTLPEEQTFVFKSFARAITGHCPRSFCDLPHRTSWPPHTCCPLRRCCAHPPATTSSQHDLSSTRYLFRCFQQGKANALWAWFPYAALLTILCVKMRACSRLQVMRLECGP